VPLARVDPKFLRMEGGKCMHMSSQNVGSSYRVRMGGGGGGGGCMHGGGGGCLGRDKTLEVPTHGGGYMYAHASQPVRSSYAGVRVKGVRGWGESLFLTLSG